MNDDKIISYKNQTMKNSSVFFFVISTDINIKCYGNVSQLLKQQVLCHSEQSENKRPFEFVWKLSRTMLSL